MKALKRLLWACGAAVLTDAATRQSSHASLSSDGASLESPSSFLQETMHMQERGAAELQVQVGVRGGDSTVYYWEECNKDKTCVDKTVCQCLDESDHFGTEAQRKNVEDYKEKNQGDDKEKEVDLYGEFEHRCVVDYDSVWTKKSPQLGCNRFEANCDKTLPMMTFAMTHKSGLGPQQKDWFGTEVTPDTGLCERESVSQHQMYTVKQQLEFGIRALDIPVGMDKDTELVTYSGTEEHFHEDFRRKWLGGEKIEDMVEDVMAFLNDYPNDFVVLDFSEQQPDIVRVTDSWDQQTTPGNVGEKFKSFLSGFFVDDKKEKLISAEEWIRPSKNLRLYDSYEATENHEHKAPDVADLEKIVEENCENIKPVFRSAAQGRAGSVALMYPGKVLEMGGNCRQIQMDGATLSFPSLLRLDCCTSGFWSDGRAEQGEGNGEEPKIGEPGSGEELYQSWLQSMAACNQRRFPVKKALNFVATDQFQEMMPSNVEVADYLNMWGTAEADSIWVWWLKMTLLWSFIFVCIVGMIIYENSKALLSERSKGSTRGLAVMRGARGMMSLFKGSAAQNVPEGWERWTDKESGKVYFHNPQTQVSIWEEDVWEEHDDPDTGKKYRLNLITEEKVYEGETAKIAIMARDGEAELAEQEARVAAEKAAAAEDNEDNETLPLDAFDPADAGGPRSPGGGGRRRTGGGGSLRVRRGCSFRGFR
uniref:WW domain-containing protein n=1 Tax=Chromera velia CCMP2878 TaxID=1169474 RepID=A0A0G4GLQ0_9ALVE|eukprot:Cvel_22459.t1-p1 / transcript=Cvel_22459.t1 / gene=Cvel_22459 / organism=Chromera_velia_CCMP2878 / gene_product=hypothetical protein / transcript_product=hypothetical protein / location=Cvel_scaffold2209:1805-10714(+) / protein_length=703 / sequence_SO=supercontig / SO=protein_coding / is_pseudo=false